MVDPGGSACQDNLCRFSAPLHLSMPHLVDFVGNFHLPILMTSLGCTQEAGLADHLRVYLEASKAGMPGRKSRMRSFQMWIGYSGSWMPPSQRCPAAEITKMTAQEDKTAPRKRRMAGWERRMPARERWMPVREIKKPAGQASPAVRERWIAVREDSKSGGERKNAAGILKTAAGKRKKAWGSIQVRCGSPTRSRGGSAQMGSRLLDAKDSRRRRVGSLTSEVRQEAGTGGRPPGVLYLRRSRGWSLAC